MANKTKTKIKQKKINFTPTPFLCGSLGRLTNELIWGSLIVKVYCFPIKLVSIEWRGNKHEDTVFTRGKEEVEKSAFFAKKMS